MGVRPPSWPSKKFRIAIAVDPVRRCVSFHVRIDAGRFTPSVISPSSAEPSWYVLLSIGNDLLSLKARQRLYGMTLVATAAARFPGICSASRSVDQIGLDRVCGGPRHARLAGRRHPAEELDASGDDRNLNCASG